MKKLLAILLVLMMAMAVIGCAAEEAVVEPEPEVTEPEATEPEVTEPEVTEPEATEPEAAEPETAEPEVVEYTLAPLQIDFKNKTGVTITGLYLYVSGTEQKGNSLCAAEWLDKDNDPDETHYEFFAYVLRPVDVLFDLYVEFADGTNATWEGLTIANYDKLSLKDGVDPSTWEQEAVDDPEDIAKMDEFKAAGKTSDGFYGDYAILGLEIKNKTGLNITEFYFYEAGGDPMMYNNMVEYLIDADGNPITSWQSGKGGLYVFDFFIRPLAEAYEVYVVYEDGSNMTVTDIDLFTPNGDGFCSNEISMKDAVDPDLTEVSYDDGDPEPLQLILDAIAEGIPADNWYPTF